MAVKEANHRALRMQSQTTQQLVQRVKDLKYWSGEIDRYLFKIPKLIIEFFLIDFFFQILFCIFVFSIYN